MNLRVGLIGRGPHAEARRKAAEATAGVIFAEHLPEATAAGVLQRQEAALDVVFTGSQAGRRVESARAALRQGRHVFLEWPPTASIPEAEQLAERAEEAGAEVGVSRPLRFHPLFEAVPGGVRADLLSVEGRFSPNGSVCWSRHLADTLDLCGALAGSRSRPGAGVRRFDAHVARSGEGRRLDAVAGGLRFHSGAYAQLDLRRRLADNGRSAIDDPTRRFYAAGAGFRLTTDLDAPTVTVQRGEHDATTATAGPDDHDAFPQTLLYRETCAFLNALRAGRPVPVSILDALAVLRLAERFMQQLR